MTVIAAGITGGIPYETLTIVLAANDVRAISKTTAYLSILSATTPGGVQVSFNGASFFTLPPGIAISDFLVDELWIKDISGGANTVVIATGVATFRDNRLVIDAASPLPVTLAANSPINLAQFGGTAVVNGGTAGLSGVGGPTAHSAASTGNPVRVAGRVQTAVDTTLVAGDVCDMFATDGGAQVVKPYAVPQADWQYAAAAAGILNTAVAVTVKAAAAAGVRNYITGIEIEWEALGAATEFAIRDGAAGTVIYRTKLGAAGGRKTITFPTPLKGTAATLLEIVTLTASVTGAVYANLQGYIAP